MRGVVLALGGGGVRGAAHNGLLDVLAEAKVPVSGLAGSSAGALAAAVFAFGLEAKHDVVAEWLKDPELERLQKSGMLRQVARMVDFVRRPYLAEGTRIREGYRKLFEDRRIEDSPIPLVIQATDLNSGELVMLRAGLVSEALAASSAVPSIFPPVPWHGRLLVDGDVAEKVPVTAAKALGVGPVVAVDVSNLAVVTEPKSALEAVLQAGEASRRRLLALALKEAELRLELSPHPPIETFDYTKSETAYGLGRALAEAALPEIERLLRSENQPLPSRTGWLDWLKPKTQPNKAHKVAAKAEQTK